MGLKIDEWAKTILWKPALYLRKTAKYGKKACGQSLACVFAYRRSGMVPMKRCVMTEF